MMYIPYGLFIAVCCLLSAFGMAAVGVAWIDYWIYVPYGLFIVVCCLLSVFGMAVGMAWINYWIYAVSFASFFGFFLVSIILYVFNVIDLIRFWVFNVIDLIRFWRGGGERD